MHRLWRRPEASASLITFTLRPSTSGKQLNILLGRGRSPLRVGKRPCAEALAIQGSLSRARISLRNNALRQFTELVANLRNLRDGETLAVIRILSRLYAVEVCQFVSGLRPTLHLGR